MSPEDLAFSTLADIGRALRRGETSASELVHLMVQRIDKYDPVLGSYQHVFAQEAAAQAADLDAEARRGSWRGPLHGVPISIKDVIEAGPTSCGSASLENYRAPQEATVVARLRAAGAIILGKAATYEFAAGAPYFGGFNRPTRNPWRPDRETGGSSSGSAGSVSAGLAYGSVGTDTGASIRFPAMSCHLVGLKPTYGRISRSGVFPLSWSADHVGTLTRTAEDAALMLEAMAGYDRLDPASADEPVGRYGAELGQSLQGVRVGVLQRLIDDGAEESVRTQFSASLDTLANVLDARIVSVAGPTLAELVAVGWSTTAAEVAAAQMKNLREGHEFSARYRQQALLGLLIDGPQYLIAQRVRAQMTAELLTLLEDEIDVIVMPTSGFRGAPPLARVPPQLSSLSLNGPRFTKLFNLTGMPAVQVPTGLDHEGVPTGIQIAGRPFEESTILAIAHQAERALAGPLKRPDLGLLEGIEPDAQ